MKTRFTLFAFLFLCLTGLNAQTGWFSGTGVPLKPQSPLFGKDIVINDQPTESQQHVAVCSAFNGWLFSAYTYDSTNHTEVIRLLKSVDNGVSWTGILYYNLDYLFCPITKLDLVTSGKDLTNLKVILGFVWYNIENQVGGCSVCRFNGVTGNFEENINKDGDMYIRDVALASDILYPAINSNPNSLAILYSKSCWTPHCDSIILMTSSNGGMTFESRQSVILPFRSSLKVAISYGYSASLNTGRYLAAWETKADFLDNFGHIYTAHTEPNFNSPFTKPVCLDSLDASLINKVRNPVISCQYSNVDNDSANLTEVVLFEKYKPASMDYDVTGFYNLQATTTSHFRPLNIAATSNNELQPDISFNPYNSKFMVTYFDSTNKKLPFLTNDFNLSNPNSWNVVNSGYNDNSNIVAPNPKIRVNFGNQDGMNAWISEGTGGNGVALFDAPYSTYTGISGKRIGTTAKLIGSYPNPCSNTIKIAFELKNAGKVTIEIMSIMGQPIGRITDQNYPAGKQVVPYDVSNLPDGNYLYRFRSGDFTATGKFTVIR